MSSDGLPCEARVVDVEIGRVLSLAAPQVPAVRAGERVVCAVTLRNESGGRVSVTPGALISRLARLNSDAEVGGEPVHGASDRYANLRPGKSIELEAVVAARVLTGQDAGTPLSPGAYRARAYVFVVLQAGGVAREGWVVSPWAQIAVLPAGS